VIRIKKNVSFLHHIKKNVSLLFLIILRKWQRWRSHRSINLVFRINL